MEMNRNQKIIKAIEEFCVPFVTQEEARDYLINKLKTHCLDGSLHRDFGGNEMNIENITSILEERFPGFYDETYIRAATQILELNTEPPLLKVLKEELKKDFITVVFTKADGSVREMYCTLNPEYLPALDPNKEKKSTKPKDQNLVTVFEKDVGWKSFKFDSVTRFWSDNLDVVIRSS